MGLLGLELSDVGIMVAAEAPDGLLQLDGSDRESPGFALPDRKRLLVGREAASRARLDPRQVSDRFWDELSTEPLQQPVLRAQNHAEIAHAHLAKIWDNIRGHGDALVLAVPGFVTRNQLGLILGIAGELSIPVRGMAPLGVAAAALEPCPERLLLHVDIHRHRSEVTYLEQGERLTLNDSANVTGKGLQQLHAEWVQAIADEFVRATRFDPFDQARHEQELHDRLPGILPELLQRPSVVLEMRAGSETYRVTLKQEVFLRKSAVVFGEIETLIEVMRERHGKPGQPVTLQVTHRVTRLPGFQEMVAKMPGLQVVELGPGAGALGVLRMWGSYSAPSSGRGVSFLTSRPWQPTRPAPVPSHPTDRPVAQGDSRPTHLLYRNLAYPISDQPLIIDRGDDGVRVRGWNDRRDVPPEHCSIQLQGEDVVLTDHGDGGVFVDGTRVAGTGVLGIGQLIRVGAADEELQLIACVEPDEA